MAGTSLNFTFNPTQYTVKKSNQWTFEHKKASNVPSWEFAGGGPRELQLELFFDASMPPRNSTPNIRAITNMLFGFMMIDKGLKSQAVNSQLGRPPKCRLEWGHDTPFHFECYVTDCSVTYSLFSEDGAPIRATAQMTLKEVKDPDNLARQNPTSGGEPGRRVHVVREGDRIDLIAFQYYKNAFAWRVIADANRLSDPSKLEPGGVLEIPVLHS
jgi:hypothetical protein